MRRQNNAEQEMVRIDEEESKEAKRNREYLLLIFDHPSKVVEKTLKDCGEMYSCAYDELVRMHGHGTPGRRAVRGAYVPPITRLTPTARTSVACSGTLIEHQNGTNSNGDTVGSLPWRRARVQHACSYVERFKRRDCAVQEFWRRQWGESYEGFLRVQRELGVLRDEMSDTRWFGEEDEYVCDQSVTSLKQMMGYMLRNSAGEWYKRWGELDLHRLCVRDALHCINEFMKRPAWNEMRIVAGQKQHMGDDHNSEGVLYDLIHRLFDVGWMTTGRRVGAVGEDADDAVCDEIKSGVERGDVDVRFYSNGAAVLLRKGRGATVLRSLESSRAWHVKRQRAMHSANWRQ
eukprot:gb/GEZJ01004396.1/.p1 GENE.gb/GEZJ01004396.1/~~gb/GEZJ01004396.1/.p1  ORF type:complete len:346 (-),score=42.74 gb/GEZJ01004396.1/:178-1215(-)